MRSCLIAARTEVTVVITHEARTSSDGLETGGILIGADDGEVIVLETAGGPGPNADRRPDGFLRDLGHARELAEAAFSRNRSIWLGEWHTHLVGGPTPSDRDKETYAGLLEDEGLEFERIVSIIAMPSASHAWDSVTLWPWVVTRGLTIRPARLVVTNAQLIRASGD